MLSYQKEKHLLLMIGKKKGREGGKCMLVFYSNVLLYCYTTGCSKISQNCLSNRPLRCVRCIHPFSCFAAAEMSQLTGKKRISKIF